MSGYTIRRCPAPACALRFPASADEGSDCPRCGTPTTIVERFTPTATPAAAPRTPARRPVIALLDNLRSLYNVGAIFRSADGAGVMALHLCGTSATPDHPRLAKTALGAEKMVPWHYHPDALRAAIALQKEGWQLWGLETGAESADLLTLPKSAEPVALLVGNERSGLDPALLRLCDRIVSVPMRGHKESLNVASAFAIAAYALT
jgi:tRNA G18 (ribose-2'-O)-methylase SpoU